jgi:hypothetical protein
VLEAVGGRARVHRRDRLHEGAALGDDLVDDFCAVTFVGHFPMFGVIQEFRIGHRFSQMHTDLL